MRMHDRKFRTIDPDWELDLALLKVMCGDEGQDQIRAAWMLQCVPDAKRWWSVDVACEQSKMFVGCDSFTWACAKTRGEVATADAWLSKLRSGEPPCAWNEERTPWLDTLHARLGVFVRVEAADGKDKDKSEPSEKQWLFGSEALLKRWGEVAAAEAKKLTYDRLAIFNAFGHLLRREERLAFDKKLREVDGVASKRSLPAEPKAAAGKTRASKRARGSQEPAPPAHDKDDDDDDARVAKMLGLQ